MKWTVTWIEVVLVVVMLAIVANRVVRAVYGSSIRAWEANLLQRMGIGPELQPVIGVGLVVAYLSLRLFFILRRRRSRHRYR